MWRVLAFGQTVLCAKFKISRLWRTHISVRAWRAECGRVCRVQGQKRKHTWFLAESRDLAKRS